MHERLDEPYAAHVAALLIVGICVATGALVAAPLLLLAAALVLRSRMLLFAGFGLSLLYVAFLVVFAGIGGSVGGGLAP